MKKLFTLISAVALGCMGFNASAQSLGEITLLDPTGKYCTPIATLYFGYNEDVELVDPIGDEYDQHIMIDGTFNGSAIEAEMFEATFYDDVSYKATSCLAVYLYTVTGMEPGTLTLDIPEGVVKGTKSGYLNPAETLEFVMMNSVNSFTVSPEADKTYNPDSLSEVTLTFPGNISLSPSESEISLVYNFDTNNPTLLTSEFVTIEGKTLSLKLNNLSNGNWTIIVPEGYLFIEGTDETLINSALRLDYKVWEGMSSATLLSPEELLMTTLDAPVELTWNYETVSASEAGLKAFFSCDAANVYLLPVPDDAFSFITYTPGEEGGPSLQEGDLSGTILKIDLSSFAEYLVSGYYFTLDIPAGIVESNKGENPQQSFYFSYLEFFDGAAEMTIDGNIMKITWPTAAELDCNFEKDILLLNSEGEKTILNFTDFSHPDGQIELIDWTVLTLNLADLNLAEGTYTLIIPEASVIIYPYEYNWTDRLINLPEEFTFRYDGNNFTTAVELVKAINENIYRVYDMQGINLLNTADINSVKQLPAGLYIINGKKVFIK